MAARLKVFVTSDGLTDYVVAVSSRAKALAAWNVRQNLFKEGQAHETDDRALVKAALKQPGQVLRRAAGSRGDLAKLKPAKTATPPGPTKAQRRKVADLEAQLAALDRSQARARAKLEAKRDELDRRLAAVAADHAAERKRLDEKLSAARQALG